MAKRKTIANELQKLIDSKADIAEAIEQMGGIVPSEFSQYGDAIRRLHIDEGNPVLFIDYDGRVISTKRSTLSRMTCMKTGSSIHPLSILRIA